MAGWKDGLLFRANPQDKKASKNVAKKPKNKKPAAKKPAKKSSNKRKSSTTTTTTTTKVTKKNPKRKKRNPSDQVEKAKKSGMRALALAGGALAVEAIDRLLVPAEYRRGLVGAAVRGVTSLGLGALAEVIPVKQVADNADSIRDGGLAMTIFMVGAEKALPYLPSDVLVGKLLGMSGPESVNGRMTFQKNVNGRLTFQKNVAGRVGRSIGAVPGSGGAPGTRRLIAG